MREHEYQPVRREPIRFIMHTDLIILNKVSKPTFMDCRRLKVIDHMLKETGRSGGFLENLLARAIGKYDSSSSTKKK